MHTKHLQTKIYTQLTETAFLDEKTAKINLGNYDTIDFTNMTLMGVFIFRRPKTEITF